MQKKLTSLIAAATLIAASALTNLSVSADVSLTFEHGEVITTYGPNDKFGANHSPAIIHCNLGQQTPAQLKLILRANSNQDTHLLFIESKCLQSDDELTIWLDSTKRFATVKCDYLDLPLRDGRYTQSSVGYHMDLKDSCISVGVPRESRGVQLIITPARPTDGQKLLSCKFAW
ncbi:MAG: hypothetical protein LBJ95_01935 [Oscillospiraceae bacterium]|jgi:hypothetical protein|nr:hypothetical protein [Oscillospiraceae bacterium]